MRRNKKLNFELDEVDLVRDFTNALSTSMPWDSIVDFATHKSFCGQVLYPRQLTLLKLIFLETENFTAYDLEVIEEWSQGFSNRNEVYGVQPDIWQRIEWLKSRGYPHFPHIQSIIGRRGSKGVIGGILGAWILAYFFWLDNWQNHFGVKPHSDGYLSVIATTLDQAKRYQFNDIKLVVEGCAYLQPHISTDKEYYLSLTTPTDRRYYNELIRRGVPIEREIASLKAMAFSANSASSRGGAGFANFLDEFAHQITGTGSQKTSEEIYKAAQPSLRQFKKDSLTYIPSTPLSQVGMFFKLYTQGIVLVPEYLNGKIVGVSEHTEKSLRIDAEEEIKKATANPMMLVCQFPSWELYRDFEISHKLPIKKNVTIFGPTIKSAVFEYNEEVQIIEKINPEAFRVEHRAQFASVEDAYLRPEKIAAMFEEVEWRPRLEEQEKGKLSRRYLIHCDPGRSGANFAMCVAHLEDAPCDKCGWWDDGKKYHSPSCDGNIWPHVIVDKLKVWRPMDYEDGVVDYIEVQEDLIEILTKYPSTERFSLDQWNSAYFLADMKKRFGDRTLVREEFFDEKSNQRRFELFKSALNLGWIHSYRDNFYIDNEACLLELELRFLQEVHGKVKKLEVGPVTTKDLADCLMVVSVDLLHEALDRWYAQHLTKGTFGSTNAPDLRSGRSEERSKIMQGGTLQERFNNLMSERRRESTKSRTYGQNISPSRGRG